MKTWFLVTCKHQPFTPSLIATYTQHQWLIWLSAIFGIFFEKVIRISITYNINLLRKTMQNWYPCSSRPEYGSYYVESLRRIILSTKASSIGDWPKCSVPLSPKKHCVFINSVWKILHHFSWNVARTMYRWKKGLCSWNWIHWRADTLKTKIFINSSFVFGTCRVRSGYLYERTDRSLSNT